MHAVVVDKSKEPSKHTDKSNLKNDVIEIV